MANKKVAIEVEIKNIKKVADLKKELQGLRKEQKEAEKQAKTGQFTSKKQEKQYIANAKAIKNKSKSLRDLNKNLSQSSKETKNATKSSNSLSKSFIKAAAAIAVVVGAFRLVGRAMNSVISTFTEFEFVMAKVNAVSGATEGEFNKLTKSAEDLGRKTFFTATQVGELQLAYSKLGFTAQEILDATKATLDLATATGTDLARAAQVAGASIRGFQLDASEAGRVVDVMAVAFSSSALDIEKWNTSMTKVAPIAAMAGFEIEEVAAIMGKLSDTGIEASIAGTSLRNIFLKMQDPSSKLSKTLGHTITNLDEMLIAFKGLKDEGTDLTDVLGFMDVRQVAAFGTMLEGSDDIATLRDALLNATGEGERMADMVGDTLQGAFLKLKSAAQGVSISIMKNFGNSLKKSVVKISKWMNSIVGSEEAVKSFTDSITTLGEWMGRGIKIFLAWKIGIVAAGIATKIYTGYLYLATFGMEAFTLVTGYATAATLTFTRALARTGVGLLVIALGDLIYNLVSFNKEASAAIDWQDKLNKEMQGGEESIKLLEKRYEALSKAKKQINKLTNKEGKLNVDNAINRDKLKTALFNENKEVANLNKTFKANNKELINNKTNIDNVRGSLDDLIDGMKSQLAAEIFLDMEKGLIKTVISAETVMEDMKKAFNWMDDSAVQQIAKAMTEYEGTTLEWMAGYGAKAMNAIMGVDPEADNKMLTSLLDQHGLTLGTFLEAVQGGYFEDKTEGIKKAIEDKFGDINLELNIDGDEDGEGKKDAQFEIAEKIALRIKTVKDKQIIDDKEYERQLLQAKIDGVEDYLAQENNLKVGIITAKNQRNDLLRKQRKANDSQTLEDLRVQASIELTIAKEGLALKFLSEFEYAEQVYLINKQLLEDEYNLLTEKEKLGKKGADIKAKQATLELNLIKTNITEKERLLKQEFDKKTAALDLEKSTTMMSQIEFDNRMLQLEAEYLGKRAELHKGNALVLIDINNGILQNNIAVNKQQQEMMEEQISAMGGVGSALTNLAGDNEKLNGIKEAGNKISQIANILSAAMALHQNLITLGIIKGTAAKAADIAVEAGGLVVKGQTAILNQGEGDPYTSFFRIIAMVALISKVMGMWEKGGVIDDDKFARGGMVHGDSHAQGGVKFAVGGRVNELEGGEAVINKRSTAMFRNELSEMNQAGGGVKFADGGLLNSPAFAQQQFSVDRSSGNTQKVYVVESDISSTQQSVNVLEAAATI